MERFSTRAVVLSTVDFGEADRVVTFLTEEHGRLSAFANGARKSKRRFAGALEPFTLLKATLVETRGDVYRLDAVEILDSYGPLREEIGRIARASYAVELMKELCREKEAQPQLFLLLNRFLWALARENAAGLALFRFELLSLEIAGLMPRFDACARCGAKPSEQDVFDPEHGGLLCPGCVPAHLFGTRSSAEAARALVSLQRAKAGTTLEIPGRVREEARAMLSRFVAHHLGKRLKTLDFMKSVGVE